MSEEKTCENCLHYFACKVNSEYVPTLCRAFEYKTGYRKQSDVVRCKDCNYFMEYTSTYKSEVEKADGDCYIRLMNSENRQYCACQHDDFCSFAKMKGESK